VRVITCSDDRMHACICYYPRRHYCQEHLGVGSVVTLQRVRNTTSSHTCTTFVGEHPISDSGPTSVCRTCHGRQQIAPGDSANVCCVCKRQKRSRTRHTANNAHLMSKPVTAGGRRPKPRGTLAVTATTLVDIEALTADSVCRGVVSCMEHLPACMHRATYFGGCYRALPHTHTCNHNRHLRCRNVLLVPTRVCVHGHHKRGWQDRSGTHLMGGQDSNSVSSFILLGTYSRAPVGQGQQHTV
jgi:hypothetical protein